MSRDLPPPPPPPSEGLPAVSDALLRDVVAGLANEAETARVERLAAGDGRLASRLEAARAVEEALRAEPLLPLPLGLVSRILERVGEEGSLAGAPASRAAAPAPRSRRERVAIAAGAVLALGAGIGGQRTVAGSGDLRALVGASAARADASDVSPVASLASLAGEAHASTRSAVSSLAAVPEHLPGSPGALGLGAVALLGAAVAGVRRAGRGGTIAGQDGRRGAAGPGSHDGDAAGRRDA